MTGHVVTARIENVRLRDEGDGRISGIVAPYGETIDYGGGTETLAPGLFNDSLGKGRNVPLTVEHNHDQLPIGKMVKYSDRPNGLYGTFKMATTAAGQDAYQLVRDGIVDGFSVTFRPQAINRGRKGATTIPRGALLAVGLVGLPAYPSARVLATRSQSQSTVGGDMEGNTDLLKMIRSQIEENRRKIETIQGVAAAEDRDVDDAEQAEIDTLRQRYDSLVKREAELVEQAEAFASRTIEATPVAGTVDVVENARLTEVAARRVPRIASGPPTVDNMTYHRDPQMRGTNFFTDLFHRGNDPLAAERLAKHDNEMKVWMRYHDKPEMRASTTSSFAGAIPPAYLLDLVGLYRYNMRPAADMVNRMMHPGTTSIHIPIVSTQAAAGVQATEGTALTETSPATTDNTYNNATVGGQVELSRQAIDLGTLPEELVFRMLVEAYQTQIDIQVLYGSGSSGQATGLNYITGRTDRTYTSSSPTAGGTYQQIVGLCSDVAEGAAKRSPDLLIMHPRRWAYLVGGLDSSNRPLLLPGVNNPRNVIGIGNMTGDPMMPSPGQIGGVDVVVDNNISTTQGAGSDQDQVFAIRRADILLFEPAAPMAIAFDETLAKTHQVLVKAYGYIIIVADRYAAGVGRLSGTGLNATL
jgi:HK97 family phage prohead protease/HK97 family phage major capsid protein